MRKPGSEGAAKGAMAFIVDQSFSVQDVQELANRVEELEAAAAATLHVNQHLNKEIERCVRGIAAAEAESKQWKDRAKWASKQLAKKKKVDNGEHVDEAQALADMLERCDAQNTSLDEPQQGQTSSSQGDMVQPTPAQANLIRQLIARGRAAGWLVDPSEVQLGHILGKGEFGITYYAKWRGATVAVKCVRTRSAQDYTSFLREVEALAALRHPHVLPFLGACLRGPDGFWLVTEYMERGTLAEWLHPNKYKRSPVTAEAGLPEAMAASWGSTDLTQAPGPSSNGTGTSPNGQGPTHSKPKPLIERVRMACEVAQGLHALESLQPPLIHRDVKPSNVFLDGGGHARVGDFGLSRRLLPECMANLTGETGTYLYMAPEVMRHEMYDNKADVWSWGVLLVEALTGQTPYTWTYMLPEQIALGVAEEQLRPQVPDYVEIDLQVLANLALAFSPDERASFAFISQEMNAVHQKMLAKQTDSSASPTLLATVSKQLTSTWTSLLGRIYGTTGGAGGTPEAGQAPRPTPAPQPSHIPSRPL